MWSSYRAPPVLSKRSSGRREEAGRLLPRRGENVEHIFPSAAQGTDQWRGNRSSGRTVGAGLIRLREGDSLQRAGLKSTWGWSFGNEGDANWDVWRWIFKVDIKREIRHKIRYIDVDVDYRLWIRDRDRDIERHRQDMCATAF